MLDKISSFTNSYFSGQPVSSTPSFSTQRSNFVDSLCSLTNNKKSRFWVASIGLALVTGLACVLWKYKWSPLQRFFGSSASIEKENQDLPEELRCPIAKDTYAAVVRGYYLDRNGKKHSLKTGEALLANCEFFPNTTAVEADARFDKTLIEVVEQDCLDAAQKAIQDDGQKVAVLMFASPLEAGGGMSDGNNGQEEDLCRRSDIFGFMWDQAHFSAANQMYPLVSLDRADQVDPSYDQIEHNGMIHTPQVTVLRAGRAQEYAFLDEPFEVGMLISPAPNRPTLNGANYHREEDREQARKVIATQLRVACQKGYETLILGAFGCGAFRNPPHEIASLYREIINEHYLGSFKRMIFAILDDPNRGPHNPVGNLQPFQECFKSIT